jgi:hypothetical protein
MGAKLSTRTRPAPTRQASSPALSASGTNAKCRLGPEMSAVGVPAQPVDATQALNLSAGVSNCKVSRGRSLS